MWLVAFLRGQFCGIQEALPFEFPQRGVSAVQKSSHIEIVKGVFGCQDLQEAYGKKSEIP